MQDKEQIFEETFVDQSWQKLATELDKVRPIDTDKRKKSYSALLLLLCLSTLLSTGAAVYFALKFSSQIPTAQLIKEKIIALPQHSYIHLQNAIETKETTQLTKKNKASATNSNDKQLFSSSEVVAAPIAESPSKVKRSNFQDLVEIKNVKSIQPAELNISERALAEKQEDAITFTPQQSSRKPKFQISLGTSLTTDRSFTGYAVSTGMVFPINKRWGLSTGLGLNILSRDYHFFPMFDKTRAPRPTILIKEPITEDYYNSLRNLKQIFLPINVMYNITKVFALNSGVKIRYTYFEDVDRSIQLPTRRNLTVTDHESLFNNTNFGLSAGLSYKLNGNWIILLDSEWGMSTLISSAKVMDPSRNDFDLNLVNFSTYFTF